MMMPQNMEKKPDLSEQELEEQTITETETALDVETMSDEHFAYDAALELLKLGHNPKQIAQKLAEKDIVQSRPEANRLALKVAKENPQEQQTNAYILFGVATLMGGIGAVFVGFRWLAGNFAPSAIYVLFIIAAWFAFQGYQAYTRNSKK